jgi:hypothetical protein
VRVRLAVICAGALALTLSAGAAAPPFKVAFHATTHTPKVNARWPWSIAVTTNAGKPVAARITVQIVDPAGGVNPVEFGCCKRYITNYLIRRGVFRDYVIYPPEAQGYRLRFQVIVKALGARRTVAYWVKPT